MAKASVRLARPRRATTDLASGRANQKARTRQALVEAAMAFVRAGREFSIADVADAARVGRTTAYCYFPTREALFAQAVLTLVASTDYPDFYELFRDTSDVAARVAAVVETSDGSIARHEAEYRAMLRLSLESERPLQPPDPGGEGGALGGHPPPPPAGERPCTPGESPAVPRRPAYRRQWLADALAPLRDAMDRRACERLVAALSLCVGIEGHVSLRDVCGLTPQEAREVKLWVARALLAAALAEGKRPEE
jgi:AcrR family transcriptional regulator